MSSECQFCFIKATSASFGAAGGREASWPKLSNCCFVQLISTCGTFCSGATRSKRGETSIRLSPDALSLAVDQDQAQIVIGYYTIATGAIPRDALPNALTQHLPRYQNLPVALLARLAVDHRFQKSGLGRNLLRHAVQDVLSLSKQVGCRYLIVDAYPAAVSWYEKYGFIPIGDSSQGERQPMFIEVQTLAATLS